ncbi:MAG: hypothetical protein QXF25_02690 [Candidatus Pacearchaeota archaeon]
MIWFKKEKPKELPELPPLSLPKPLIPEGKKELEEKELGEKIPTLPSFPSSKTGEKISRETVKQLIQEPEKEENVEETGEEIEEEIPKIPKTFEIGGLPFKTEKPIIEKSEKGPIFVQIEKYYEILRALNEAKNKVDKINNILRNVKQLKEEEENEILEWENEILNIKENLEKVDQTIFKKLE